MIGNRQVIQPHEFAYPTVARDSIVIAAGNQQNLIHSASAYNASSGTMDVALGVRLDKSAWRVYAQTATQTEITAALQLGTATTLYPTTNNYGYIVQSKRKFSLLPLTISQTETGSPVYTYEYWNGAWTALPMRNTPVYTAAASVAVAFNPPIDWIAGGAATPFSSTSSGFCVRCLATTAPTQAVQATSLNVARMWAYRQVPTKSSLNVSFETRPIQLEGGESLQPFFATAFATNCVELALQVTG